MNRPNKRHCKQMLGVGHIRSFKKPARGNRGGLAELAKDFNHHRIEFKAHAPAQIPPVATGM